MTTGKKGFNMKKLILLAILFLTISPSFAGGVGFIDYEQIFNNYKLAQNVAKDLQNRENEIRKLIETREGEYNKLETPIQKQKFEESFRKELSEKEKAFNGYKDKKEEEVYTKIHAVTEKIRLEKGLEAIFDSRSIFSGGTDITSAVISKLNENIR